MHDRVAESLEQDAAVDLDRAADLAHHASLSGDPATGYSHGTLRQLAERGVEPEAALRLIWRSPLIPSGPHAIHIGVPSEARPGFVRVGSCRSRPAGS